MNKRGQFYIITVLVLSMALYGVTYASNTLDEPFLFENFNDVSNNYVTESVRIVNHALETEQEDGEIKDQVESFTQEYLAYAKQRTPNLGVLYIFSDGTNVDIINHLGDEVSWQGSESIPGSEQDLIQGITFEIGGTEFAHNVPIKAAEFGNDWSSLEFDNYPFDLSIGGIVHPFVLSDESPEFKIIIRTVSGEEIEFIHGSGDYPFFGPPNVQQDIV